MKRIGILAVVSLFSGLLIWGLMGGQGYPQSSGGASGPDTVTHPTIAATQCATGTPGASNQTQVLAQSTFTPPQQMSSNRLCYLVQNFSTSNTAMVGDSVSVNQGIALNPVPVAEPSSVGAVGDSATVCVTSVLKACGVGASVNVGVTEIQRP